MSEKAREWLLMLVLGIWVIVGLTLVRQGDPNFHSAGAWIVGVTGVAFAWGLRILWWKWVRLEAEDD